MTTERNLEVLKEAGAIVHSDGNIFFTNQSKLDAYTTRICADKDALILEVRKLSEQALESSQKSFDAANAIIAEQAEAIKKLRAALSKVDHDYITGRKTRLPCGHGFPCSCSHNEAVKALANTAKWEK